MVLGAAEGPIARLESSCIVTKHMKLVPFTLGLVRLAVAADWNGLEERLSVRFLPRWTDHQARHFLPTLHQALESDPASCVWRGYLMLHGADGAVIGSAGFKGPPDGAGSIEIGYGIVPAYRRRGYTFEAARALVEWAFGHPQVLLVTAHCDDGNTGSIRILEKLGMHRTLHTARVLSWELPRGGGR